MQSARRTECWEGCMLRFFRPSGAMFASSNYFATSNYLVHHPRGAEIRNLILTQHSTSLHAGLSGTLPLRGRRKSSTSITLTPPSSQRAIFVLKTHNISYANPYEMLHLLVRISKSGFGRAESSQRAAPRHGIGTTLRTS